MGIWFIPTGAKFCVETNLTPAVAYFVLEVKNVLPVFVDFTDFADFTDLLSISCNYLFEYFYLMISS